jgi:hypothetical protein
MTHSAQVESPFDENEETELAADLLAVNDEQELDHFLGNLLRRGADAVGRSLRWPILLRLGGLVKGAVHKILPVVGRALSGLTASDTGGQIGQLAAGAPQMLGMEVEGLSGEDQEFAAAKQLVRLAGVAAANAGADVSANAAREAVMHAVQLYAPGLLRSAQKHQHCNCGTYTGVGSNSGTWVRRGREFILHGLWPDHSI